jgi:peptidoglycan lytic transglycosylase
VRPYESTILPADAPSCLAVEYDQAAENRAGASSTTSCERACPIPGPTELVAVFGTVLLSLAKELPSFMSRLLYSHPTVSNHPLAQGTKSIGKIAFCIVTLCGVLFGIVGEATAQSGVASVYSHKAGRTASGEHAHPSGFTAAHRSLPFGTMVRVTNRRNGLSVVVRINDRGPFVRGRVIDVTPAAARVLGFSGLVPVVLAVQIGPVRSQ